MREVISEGKRERREGEDEEVYERVNEGGNE